MRRKKERSKQGQTNNKAKQHSTPKLHVHVHNLFHLTKSLSCLCICLALFRSHVHVYTRTHHDDGRLLWSSAGRLPVPPSLLLPRGFHPLHLPRPLPCLPVPTRHLFPHGCNVPVLSSLPAYQTTTWTTPCRQCMPCDNIECVVLLFVMPLSSFLLHFSSYMYIHVYMYCIIHIQCTSHTCTCTCI